MQSVLRRSVAQMVLAIAAVGGTGVGCNLDNDVAGPLRRTVSAQSGFMRLAVIPDLSPLQLALIAQGEDNYRITKAALGGVMRDVLRQTTNRTTRAAAVRRIKENPAAFCAEHMTNSLRTAERIDSLVGIPHSSEMSRRMIQATFDRMGGVCSRAQPASMFSLASLPTAAATAMPPAARVDSIDSLVVVIVTDSMTGAWEEDVYALQQALDLETDDYDSREFMIDNAKSNSQENLPTLDFMFMDALTDGSMESFYFEPDDYDEETLSMFALTQQNRRQMRQRHGMAGFVTGCWSGMVGASLPGGPIWTATLWGGRLGFLGGGAVGAVIGGFGTGLAAALGTCMVTGIAGYQLGLWTYDFLNPA